MQCDTCGTILWNDAIPGQLVKTYCPKCKPPTAVQVQKIKQSQIGIKSVATVNELPLTTGVGTLRWVENPKSLYCYISEKVGWERVGTTASHDEAIAKSVIMEKDKKTTRRGAIEATKRRRAARAT